MKEMFFVIGVLCFIILESMTLTILVWYNNYLKKIEGKK